MQSGSVRHPYTRTRALEFVTFQLFSLFLGIRDSSGSSFHAVQRGTGRFPKKACFNPQTRFLRIWIFSTFFRIFKSRTSHAKYVNILYTFLKRLDEINRLQWLLGNVSDINQKLRSSEDACTLVLPASIASTAGSEAGRTRMQTSSDVRNDLCHLRYLKATTIDLSHRDASEKYMFTYFAWLVQDLEF